MIQVNTEVPALFHTTEHKLPPLEGGNSISSSSDSSSNSSIMNLLNTILVSTLEISVLVHALDRLANVLVTRVYKYSVSHFLKVWLNGIYLSFHFTAFVSL